MGRRVLVTGLSTFWGGRLAQALEKDPDVDVIVGLDTREPRVELERTEYVKADQSYSILSRIVQATQVDTILHTFLIVDSTRMSGRALHEINVIGTLNLLEAARKTGVRRFVYTSTGGAIYGEAEELPAGEDSEIRPEAPYGQAKFSGEGYCDLYRRMYGLSTVSLRLGNVYGPRQDPRGEAGVIAIFCGKLRYGGWKGLRSPDFPLLNRLLGGESPTHGELLSYLFFDPEFIEELIRMGQNDARRWLNAPPGPDRPWQVEPLDAFMRVPAAK